MKIGSINRNIKENILQNLTPAQIYPTTENYPVENDNSIIAHYRIRS